MFQLRNVHSDFRHFEDKHLFIQDTKIENYVTNGGCTNEWRNVYELNFKTTVNRLIKQPVINNSVILNIS